MFLFKKLIINYVKKKKKKICGRNKSHNSNIFFSNVALNPLPYSGEYFGSNTTLVIAVYIRMSKNISGSMVPCSSLASAPCYPPPRH